MVRCGSTGCWTGGDTLKGHWGSHPLTAISQLMCNFTFQYECVDRVEWLNTNAPCPTDGLKPTSATSANVTFHGPQKSPVGFLVGILVASFHNWVLEPRFVASALPGVALLTQLTPRHDSHAGSSLLPPAGSNMRFDPNWERHPFPG